MTSRSVLLLMLVAACASPRSPHPHVEDPERDTAPRATLPIAIAVEAPAPKREGAYANVDPDDDYVEGPPDLIDDCEGRLKNAGVTFHAATLPLAKKGKITCGAPQVVTYIKGPGNVAYNSSPLMTCGMALALAQFEKVMQEEAKSILGSPIVKVEHIGTFSCREMLNYPGYVSEHAYANAIDLGAFTTKDGRRIEVYRDFEQNEPPTKAGGKFLRAISRRANDEDVFSHVLTPYWDKLHANHFHLDLARFRNDGTRPRH